MIIKEKNICFIHIPKNAGTSIEYNLTSLCEVRDRSVLTSILEPNPKYHILEKDSIGNMIRSSYFLPSNMQLQHLTLEEMSLYINPKNFFKFAVVRNPWDRIFSAVFFLKNQNYIDEKINFLDSVEKIFDEKIFSNHNYGINQIDYISVKNKILIDKIIMFDKINYEYDYIINKFDIKEKLNHKNKNNLTKNYKDYYCEKTKKMVYLSFKKDIDFFNFKF